MTFSVTSALDAFVEAQQSEREPDGLFHPSSLFGCARQAIYELRGTPKTNLRTARSRRILYIGSRLHELIQGAVTAQATVLESFAEVAISIPDLGIVGSADQLILTTDGWELEEYKTINSRAFAFGDLPKKDHVGQACVYMMALRDYGGVAQDGTVIPPLGDQLPRVRLAYVSKDDLLIGEHFVEWTDEMAHEIEQKISYLRSFSPPALPPRLPFSKGTKKDWRCGYCSFLDRCWDVDQPERAIDFDEG